ncbi:MAG: Gfo/Idh/MocA family oxidoreductase, partial [Verrucomicrobiota bacterium]
MNRRTFVRLTAGAASSLVALRAQTKAVTPRTAVVIGHTGRGNFGHGLDVTFAHRADVRVVAVSDPDEKGRAKAQDRAKAERAYADYREMLEREKPQLVGVAPRWTDQHHAMVSAALAVGAHVYCEKPFTQTLADADDLLAQARKANLKIAVAHQGRLSPDTLALKRVLDAGELGELLEIRVNGKQDRRAGGEDLMVLGTHQLDLVRYFASAEALWCTARVLHQGRDIERADARRSTEDLGKIAGDEIEALFAFPRGLNVHFTSRTKNSAAAGPWGMELIGAKGRAHLLSGPRTSVRLSLHKAGGGPSGEWLPLSDPAANVDPPGVPDTLVPNRWVVDDLLA